MELFKWYVIDSLDSSINRIAMPIEDIGHGAAVALVVDFVSGLGTSTYHYSAFTREFDSGNIGRKWCHILIWFIYENW